MYKDIHHYSEIREKLIRGLDRFSKPIISTLSPKGSNVIFETDSGEYINTNDGVTIAKNIMLEDTVENVVASIVRHASLHTNAVAGDGTTTTVLLSQKLIKEGFKLLDDGWNPMELKRNIEKASEKIIENIKKQAQKITSKKDIEFIARVSSNNDDEITKNVADAISHIDEHGMIMLDRNNDETTQVDIEDGYIVDDGYFSRDYIQKGTSSAQYENVHVLVTDKRIYYEDEAFSILETLKKEGINDVVIIARDFIGKAKNVFSANHSKGTMNILLIKEGTATEHDSSILSDIAAYLGTNLVSDTKGKLTLKVTKDDFAVAERVFCDGTKTIIKAKETVQRKLHTKSLKQEFEKDKDNEKLKKRIAKLTTGIVTIKVGATTDVELREKLYRYEDAVNAAQVARREGYVIGGGMGLYRAIQDTDLSELPLDIKRLYDNISVTPLQQIAQNCNIHFDTMLENVKKGKGYNAIKDSYGDLLKDGVIEPVLVLKFALQNAVSVAGVLLSSQYIITNSNKHYEQEDKESDRQGSK